METYMKTRKLNMKSMLLCILLVISMLATTLTGCGNAGTPNDTSASSEVDSSSELDTSTETETQSKPESFPTGGNKDDSTESTETESESETQSQNPDTSTGNNNNTTGNTGTTNNNTNNNSNTGNTNTTPNTGSTSTPPDFKTPGISLSQIPAYSGTHYIVLNNNKPHFSTTNLSNAAFEYYSDLDSLGRCGVAYACLGKETMPADGEKRGSISSVKPTGWIQKKYDCIKTQDLYNRSHLIAWSLSAENANKQNLITGTPQLNQNNMTIFEDMVRDKIKELGIHVMYRVTPFFEGNNLVASGVQMEAWSVEDNGASICFNVYIYNVQDGVIIDYATGESRAENESSTTTPDSSTQTPSTEDTAVEDAKAEGYLYVVNKNNGTIHSINCSSVESMKATNRLFFKTYEEAKAKSIEISGITDGKPHTTCVN